MKRLLVAAGFMTGALAAPRAAQAGCMTLISGPVVYDVAACKAITPEQIFDTKKDKYSWIAGLDAAGRKKFFDSYRGLYLKGKVVKSNANAKGLATEEGALNGDTIYTYVPPSALRCDGVVGKRIGANLREICCEGGGDPPCLLDTSYMLTGVQPVGQAATGAGDQVRQKAKRSKDYQAAEAAFRAHKWKDAAKLYEKARTNGELDVNGYYRLGFSFRELDQCGDAIAPLKYVNDQAQKKQIWADEEPSARQATFLLARCYAKMNDPASSVLLLDSYLLEPTKYRPELLESLKHRDFGWIHTSKEYRDYEKEARKKLSTKGPPPEVKK